MYNMKQTNKHMLTICEKDRQTPHAVKHWDDDYKFFMPYQRSAFVSYLNSPLVQKNS